MFERWEFNERLDALLTFLESRIHQKYLPVDCEQLSGLLTAVRQSRSPRMRRATDPREAFDELADEVNCVANHLLSLGGQIGSIRQRFSRPPVGAGQQGGRENDG